MNVWIINQFALPPTRAGGTRHHGLARGLQAHGIQATIVASSRGYLDKDEASMPPGRTYFGETVGGVPFVWIRTPAYDAGRASRLGSMLRFAGSVGRGRWASGLDAPDLILGSSPSPLAAYAALRLARRWGVPFVLEVRDLWPQTLIDIGRVGARHPAVRSLAALERHLYRQADRILTLMPGAERHVEAVCPGAEAKVTWLPNGVDLSRPPERPRDALRDGEPFRVVYAGAHGAANALAPVLEAARLLEAAGPRACAFEFIGDGHHKADLARLAQRMGLSSVSFSPAVAKAEVPARLARADALIVNMQPAELYRFGVSFNKLYDYLAAARPIIFGTAAANDPVREAGAGLSVAASDPRALADAVRSLAAMPAAERQAMGARGRAYAEEHHDIRKLAARLAESLREVQGAR